MCMTMYAGLWKWFCSPRQYFFWTRLTLKEPVARQLAVIAGLDKIDVFTTVKRSRRMQSYLLKERMLIIT